MPKSQCQGPVQHTIPASLDPDLQKANRVSVFVSEMCRQNESRHQTAPLGDLEQFDPGLHSLLRLNIKCAFDIFQKVVFCLVLYKEEVNLQSFVMI